MKSIKNKLRLIKAIVYVVVGAGLLVAPLLHNEIWLGQIHKQTTPLVQDLPKDVVQATVQRTIDGDTLVLTNGEHVRLIGIDTPELHDKDSRLRAFALRAKALSTLLTENKTVYLQKDVSETDRYGRLLRYVYIPQNQTLPKTSSLKSYIKTLFSKDPTQKSATKYIMLNRLLVYTGYATAKTYPPDVQFQELFLEDQKHAQTHNLGLWKPN